MPGDPYVAPPPAQPFSTDVGTSPGSLRVGLYDGQLHPDCAAAVAAAGRLLSGLGHRVEVGHPAALDEHGALVQSFSALVAAWVARSLDEWGKRTGHAVGAAPARWSDFVLGTDTPKASRLHGKFVYAGIPPKAGQTAQRHAETEPSLLAISMHSRAPEPTYLFLQWMVDKTTQKDLISSLGGGVPVRNSSWSLPEIENSPNASLFKAMRESLKYGYAKPKAPKLYEIADVAGATLQEIATGKISAEQGMKAAQEKVVRICQKCFLGAAN